MAGSRKDHLRPPPLLGSLRANFSGALSPGFKQLQVEVAPLSGTVAGVDLAGSLGYDATAPEPLALRLAAERAPLANLSPYLGGGRITGGTAAFALTLTGNRAALHGTVAAAVDGLTGTTPSGKQLTIHQGEVNAAFRGGEPFLPGPPRFTGSGGLGSSPVVAAFSFSLTRQLLRLEDGVGSLGGVRFSFGEFQGKIPSPPFTLHEGVPAAAEIRELNMGEGDLTLEGVSGLLAGIRRVPAEGGRFEGGGDLTARRLAWRSWGATGLAARFTGDDGGMSGDITGPGLGGEVAAVITLPPSLRGNPVSFRLNGRRLLPGEIMNATGRVFPVTIAHGLLDAQVAGSFSSSKGVDLDFTATGSGLTIMKEGRALLAGVGLSAAGEYDRGNFRLRQGRVTAGGEVGINLAGEIHDLPATTRSGGITFTMPEYPLTALTNACAALLPPEILEVSTEGTLALHGAVTLGEGMKFPDGELRITGGEVALPSRQFNADGIQGTFPFSLVFSES